MEKNENSLSFLYENRTIFLLGFTALFFIVCIFYFKLPSQSKIEKRIFALENSFSHWNQNPSDIETEKNFFSLLKKYPEYQSKYDALIAQRYLRMDEYQKAFPFAQKALQRVKEKSPYFIHFSETSLLIANHSYKEALEKAEALKKDLQQDPLINEDSALFTLNLLRIADLQHHLEMKSELASLEELLDQSKKHQPLFSAFQKNQANLSDYLSYRKNTMILN